MLTRDPSNHAARRRGEQELSLAHFPHFPWPIFPAIWKAEYYNGEYQDVIPAHGIRQRQPGEGEVALYGEVPQPDPRLPGANPGARTYVKWGTELNRNGVDSFYRDCSPEEFTRYLAQGDSPTVNGAWEANFWRGVIKMPDNAELYYASAEGELLWKAVRQGGYWIRAERIRGDLPMPPNIGPATRGTQLRW